MNKISEIIGLRSDLRFFHSLMILLIIKLPSNDSNDVIVHLFVTQYGSSIVQYLYYRAKDWIMEEESCVYNLRISHEYFVILFLPLNSFAIFVINHDRMNKCSSLYERSLCLNSLTLRIIWNSLWHSLFSHDKFFEFFNSIDLFRL